MKHRKGVALLCALLGCSSTEKEAPALTGDPALNRCLARLDVTRCAVATVPTAKPGQAVKARATLSVRQKGAARGSSGVQLKVYDPAAGAIADADSDGSAVVPVAGVLLAVAGGGAVAGWKFIDGKKDHGGGHVDIAPDTDTPISVPTTKPANPDLVNVTAKSNHGEVNVTAVATTEDAVLGTAPLTPEDAGPITFTATEDGQVIGTTTTTAVYSSIEWNPSLASAGQTAQLTCTFLPADRTISATITLNCQAQPTLIKPGTITGSANAWVVTFQGNAGQLSAGPILAAVAGETPIEASLDVQEAP